MKVVIIAEGGKQLGMGHIIRMKRLALALRSELEPCFVMREYQAPASNALGVQLLRNHGFQVETVSFATAQAAVERHNPERIIIDSYDWRGYDLAALLNFAPVILFDDGAPIFSRDGEGSVATAIVKLTAAQRQRLQVIQPGFPHPMASELDVNVVSGPEYCLLGSEYQQQFPFPPKKQLLVTFGSTDPEHVTDQVLPALVACQIPSLIVIGPAFSRQVTAYQQAYPQPWLTFSPPVPSLHPLLSQCTHVLSSGSTTMYEVLATGRCLATIACVPNQIVGAQSVAAAKQSHHFGWYADITTSDLVTQLQLFWQAKPSGSPFPSDQAAALIFRILKKTIRF